MKAPARPPLSIQELTDGFTSVENHGVSGGFLVGKIYLSREDLITLLNLGQSLEPKVCASRSTDGVFGYLCGAELRIDPDIDPMGWKRMRIVSEPHSHDGEVVTAWI